MSSDFPALRERIAARLTRLRGSAEPAAEPVEPPEDPPVDLGPDLDDEHLFPTAAASYTYDPDVPAWRPPTEDMSAEDEEAMNASPESEMTDAERNIHRRRRWGTRQRWLKEQADLERRSAEERARELEERGQKFGSIPGYSISGAERGGRAEMEYRAEQARLAHLAQERAIIRAQNAAARDPRLRGDPRRPNP